MECLSKAANCSPWGRLVLQEDAVLAESPIPRIIIQTEYSREDYSASKSSLYGRKNVQFVLTM